MNLFLLFFASFLPNIAYASLNSFLKNVNSLIINPLIKLLFALGIAYFLYGAFMFLKNADNENVRTEGKNHMMYGLIGLTVMMGVWGILTFVLNTLDIKGINPEKGTVNLENYNPSSPLNGGNTNTGSGNTGTGTGNGNGNGNTATDLDPVLDDPILDNGSGSDPVDVDDNSDPVGPSGFDPVIDSPNSGGSDIGTSNGNPNTSTPSGFDPVGTSTTNEPSLPSNPTSNNTSTSQTQTFTGNAPTE